MKEPYILEALEDYLREAFLNFFGEEVDFSREFGEDLRSGIHGFLKIKRHSQVRLVEILANSFSDYFYRIRPSEGPDTDLLLHFDVVEGGDCVRLGYNGFSFLPRLKVEYSKDMVLKLGVSLQFIAKKGKRVEVLELLYLCNNGGKLDYGYMMPGSTPWIGRDLSDYSVSSLRKIPKGLRRYLMDLKAASSYGIYLLGDNNLWNSRGGEKWFSIAIGATGESPEADAAFVLQFDLVKKGSEEER